MITKLTIYQPIYKSLPICQSPFKVLLIAQCFSLMPVCGINAATAQGLYFNWHSWRTWYSIVCISSTAIDAMFNINMAVHRMLDVRNVGEL